jgi:hypothetical protein
MCILCGTFKNLEFRHVEPIKQQIFSRYAKGPFAYKTILNCHKLVAPFCQHCLNHIRKRKKIKKKLMLPLDLYLLGCFHPYYMQFMDYRSQKRIKRVIAEENNFYNMVGIRPLQLFLASNNYKRTWKSINLNTDFFSDAFTAKIMRKTSNK